MKKVIVTSIIVLLIIPLLLYCYKFGSANLSNNFKEWGAFSQFYTLYVSIFTSVMLALLSWKIHKENIDLNKPLLIFTIKGKTQHPHTIKNIGNGPAINIEIYHSKTKVGWDRKIKGLTLAKDEEFLLPISGQERLGAIYYDQSGQLIKSYMNDNFIRFNKIDSELSQNCKEEIFIWSIN